MPDASGKHSELAHWPQRQQLIRGEVHEGCGQNEHDKHSEAEDAHILLDSGNGMPGLVNDTKTEEKKEL